MDTQVKVWRKDDVLELLARTDATGKKAVVNAIKGLYARQTEDERSDKTTRVSNGRGFNAKDARFLSDIAQKLPRYRDNMTDRQLYVARKMLRKYWRQLLEIIQEKGGVVEFPNSRTADIVAESQEDEGPEAEVIAEQVIPNEPVASISGTAQARWGIF
jgi:hypothetical protein